MSVVSKDGASDPAARIAIVSSPRSGNTWLRGMLSRVFGLQEFAIHTPEELDWDHAPQRCVVQIHWMRTEPFTTLLEQHGFQVVTLARHPLDVLLSALNYNSYMHLDKACLQGPSCPACAILEAKPRDPAFLDYCCTGEGPLILSHSPDWWSAPGVHRVRYEALVQKPHETLGALVADLGLDARKSIDEAVADYDMKSLRSVREVTHYHYWQGRPGHWRTMLPAAEARQIAATHTEVFNTLGYLCDPDESLTNLQADLNWFQVQHAAMRKHLNDERNKHEATCRDLADARAWIASAKQIKEQAETPPVIADSEIGSNRSWQVHSALSTVFRRIARQTLPSDGSSASAMSSRHSA
ncbi:MAG: sulfotransferase domain-containing protein [Isosphaeraceae bacterium]